MNIPEISSVPLGRFYCVSGDSAPNAFRVRVSANGISGVTGIQAYVYGSDPTSDEQPVTGSSCISSSPVSGHTDVYALYLSDGDCQTNGGTLIRVLGTSQYFNMICDSTMPYEVSVNSFSAEPFDDMVDQYVNPFEVKFFAVDNDDTNAPLTYAHFSQNIKFRAILQQGETDETLTNMGRIFHVAYTEQDANNNLVLQIVTASLGTRVVIDEAYAIFVKRGRAVDVVIDRSLGETNADNNDWLTEGKTIKIESNHENIGVRVISRRDGAGSSYVALPDKSLGTSYQGLTLDNPAHQDGELVIIATEDNTDVTITYNGFNTGGLKIDGANVNGNPPSSDVTLEEGEVFHIFCDDDCKELEISADEKIGVVFGARNKAHVDNNDNGDVMTQLTPTDRFHDHFVVSTLQGYTGAQYILVTDDPSDTFVVVSDDASPASTVNPLPHLTSPNNEQKFTQEIGYYFHAPGGSNDPSLLPIPSVVQWNWRYYVYMKEGPTYKLTFIGKNLLDIEFLTGSVTTDLSDKTLNDQGVATTVVNQRSGYPESWEKLEIDVQATSSGTWEINQGLVEFRSPKPSNTFYLVVFEDNGSYMSSYLPFGVRYTESNTCPTPSVPMRPSNGVDDDCDGYVDEEILNGVDDDDDGAVDEDVVWDQDSDVTGIYVQSMIIEGAFDSTKVIFQRCAFEDYDDEYGQFSFHMDHFKHNTHLAREFNDLYVVDSGVVNAIRFVDSMQLTATLTYGFCNGNMTRCEDSCPEDGNRRKRSDDDENLKSVTLRLPIIRNETTSQKEEGNKTLITSSFSIKLSLTYFRCELLTILRLMGLLIKP
ncbi:hypothetical protein ACF0H5_024560 [Mactra antiquata]